MATHTPDPSALEAGRYLPVGPYRILHHVASGGMGAVYKAIHTDLGREVALKILNPDLSANPTRLERFRREARHSSKLRHENIATLYEIGEANGLHFLALEFVDGIDLSQHVRRHGPVETEMALEVCRQAAQALDCAHQHGITHRDVKPSNILLTQRDGRLLVKLTDFGCARTHRDEDFQLTEAGHTVGTIDYMAPEQARDGRLADIRSDLYSLGCTLYHMLSGRPPFPDGTLTERLYKHLQDEPVDVRVLNRRVSAGVWNLLRKLLSKKPEDRFQTPSELLRELADGPPEPATTESVEAEPNRDPDESSPLVPVSPEQRQAAAGQYGRAKEVLANNQLEYAIQLLLNCCKLHPTNLLYRRVLRKVEKLSMRAKKGRGSRWLSGFTGKAKFSLAKQKGDHRKVLEHGEELLVGDPYDSATQAAMAESAELLGLPRLTLWLMTQAQQAAPNNVPLSRALARLHETHGNYAQAIKLWEVVRKADPTDIEASRKVKDLHASETIARGNYTESIEGIDALEKRLDKRG